MSKIALEGNASGTGTFTIASPNSNSNYTLTLPTSTGTVVVTGGAQTIEFAAGSAASPSITFTGDTNTGIFSPGADSIGFAEGGAEIARFDSSGNFGIGTSSPLARLDVKPAAENILTGGLRVSTHNNTTQYGVIANDGALQITSVETSVSAPSIRFNTSTNGSTVTERMRIDSSGNVGIGTSSITAAQKVIVSLATNAPTTGSPANGSLFTLSGGTTTVGNGPSLQIQNFSGAKETAWRISAVSTSGNNGDLVFNGYAGGADYPERARITSAGYLLVGTTSNPSNGMVAISYARGTTAGMRIQDTVGSGGNGVIADFYNSSGTSVGSITHNSSNTTYGTSSDYRLKENVQPMTGALARVAALKPCTYRWKETGIDGEGFIAHELQAVVPDAVVGEKDAVNEDGSIKPQSIDTSFLVATLTAAIQELKAITDAQATRIEALEAEVAALKGQ